MSGRELADAARQLDPQLPIVFMTGYAGDLPQGSDFIGSRMKLLRKPFRLTDLLNQVRQPLACSHG